MEKQELYEIQNLRAFEVKFLGATNTQGSRIKIKDLRHKFNKTLSYTYKYDNISEYALEYLNSIGFKVVKKVCLDDKDLLLCESFEEVEE